MPTSSSIQQFVTEEEIINGEPSTNNQTPASLGRCKGFYRIFILISLLSSALLFAFDQTVTSDSQEEIIASFKPGGEVLWISVPFMLGAVLSRNIWYVKKCLIGSLGKSLMIVRVSTSLQEFPMIWGASDGLESSYFLGKLLIIERASKNSELFE